MPLKLTWMKSLQRLSQGVKRDLTLVEHHFLNKLAMALERLGYFVFIHDAKTTN